MIFHVKFINNMKVHTIMYFKDSSLHSLVDKLYNTYNGMEFTRNYGSIKVIKQVKRKYRKTDRYIYLYHDMTVLQQK